MDEKKIARINQLAAKAKTPEGLTQEELADRAELSKGFISQLERDCAGSISTRWWATWPGSWTIPMWWMSTATSASSARKESSDGLFL